MGFPVLNFISQLLYNSLVLILTQFIKAEFLTLFFGYKMYLASAVLFCIKSKGISYPLGNCITSGLSVNNCKDNLFSKLFADKLFFSI